MSPQTPHVQDEVLQHSLQKPEEFWAHQADQLHWHKKPDSILRHDKRRLKSGAVHDTWEWFAGGEISTSYNCLDRHVLNGNGDQVAIIYDSPVTNTKAKYTYKQLLDEVRVLAGALQERGVKKGDVVMLYMPMIPAAIIGILAATRIGAIHTVVFGGFASNALAQRIDACSPVVILTASCGIEVNKIIAYQPLVEKAIEIATHKPQKVFIWQRNQVRWSPNRTGGQETWQNFVNSARNRNITADCVPVKSSDPLYILYTSGTTGTPKGVVRDAGGHAVGLQLSASYLMNLHGPGDVAFTASDIGWVVGHSFIIYAPLLVGAATVVYEGKPVGTPDPSSFWRIVEEYRVNSIYTAPTALRAIKRFDPYNRFLSKIGERGGLRSLKAMLLAGERSEPTIVTMYQDLLNKYGAKDSHVVDSFWSTEMGTHITGRALAPHTGKDRKSILRDHPPPIIKPGSAGKAMPGFRVHVIDDAGKEVQEGGMGNIVLGLPLPPTAFRTLWKDDERYWRSYLERFDGKWMDTGDAGFIDKEGYVHVMARSDDVLSVSAHRLSSGEIEQAITSHPQVVEACVVGIPDALKGQLPFAFITLSTQDQDSAVIPSQEVSSEIQRLVRSQVGPIASLGGIIQGRGIIPKTRSGKSLRRVLRALVENAVDDELSREVSVPSTIEDIAVVEAAREKVKEYFSTRAGIHSAVEGMVKAKL